MCRRPNGICDLEGPPSACRCRIGAPKSGAVFLPQAAESEELPKHEGKPLALHPVRRHRYHRAGRWVRGCHRRCCRRCSRRGKRRTREHAMHNEQRVLRSLFVRVEHLLCGLVGGGRCLHVRSDGRWLLHRRRLLFQRRCRRSGMPAQRLRVALAAAPRVMVAENLAGGPLNSGTRSNSFSARVICRRTPRRARNASQRETRP